MKFGRFDDERREYVITRPDTPLPWINYLGSDDYLGLISNTAGGYSFYRDARLRRLTRYRYNNAPLDVGGRYVYIRDDESGTYWSPSWQPVGSEIEDYECRHGLGYTTIGSRTNGIHTETTYFVPLGETLEVWRMRITNERDSSAPLSLFSAIEWCLWDANDDATNFQRNYSIGEVEVEDGVIYHKTEYRERRDHFAYFACSEPLAGYDTQRDDFLGPYRGWDRPLVVERGAATDSIAHGWQPIGSHHVKLELAPGESREVMFVLGYAENPRDAKFDPPRLTDHRQGRRPADHRQVPPVQRGRRPPSPTSRAHWSELLAGLQVDTPNEHLDRMVNIWNAYQCMVTFNLSRSASLFESGIGRGMGFRDSNQDLLGFVHMVPARARERILDISATQLPSGGAYHQYQPLTKRGNDAVGSGFNDDPAWLVLGVGAYLRETGDSIDPRRAGALRQRTRLGGTPLRTPRARGRVHARPARTAWPAPHRPGRLERLPQPQLLQRDPRRVLPDHREQGWRHSRVGLHRGPLRTRGTRDGGDRHTTGRRRLRPPLRTQARTDMIEAIDVARLGRCLVPPRLRLLRQGRRLHTERGGQDLRRAPGHGHHGRDRCR